MICLIDDVVDYGANQEVHDSRLKAVLECMERAGVTLNSEKRSFSQPQLKFLGLLVDKWQIAAGPGKTAVVREMRAPTNISEK